jgi:hypothetical protein
MKMKEAGLLLAAAIPLIVAAQELVTFRVPLKYRDVRSVITRVSEEVGPRGQVTVDRASNALYISDERERAGALRALIAALDVPPRRFALQASLSLYAMPRKTGLLRDEPLFTDATSFLAGTVPRASAAQAMDIREGGSSQATLIPGYTLRATAEGYDPTRRRLAFSELSLSMESASEKAPVFSGRAVLPEGEPTVFVASLPQTAEACRLSLTPVVMPEANAKERP